MIFGLKQFVQNNRTVSEGHKGYAGDEDDEGEDRDKNATEDLGTKAVGDNGRSVGATSESKSAHN